MSEQRLPIFYSRIPRGRELTGQNPETGALQEIVIDERYQLSIYDPALQTPEVQERFADFSTSRIAALGLRASGIDWGTTEAVLGGPDNVAQTDRKLASTLFALGAVGYCYRQGLLRARLLPTNNNTVDVGPFSANEKQALTLAFQGKISRHDNRTLTALQELDKDYRDTEPNLLAILTKFTALELQPHVSSNDIFYGATPPYYSAPTSELRSRHPLSKQAPSYLKDEAAFEATLKTLSQHGLLLGRHTIGFRGAEITLNYQDALPGWLGAIATQHAFGLFKDQIFGMNMSAQDHAEYSQVRAYFGLDQGEQKAECLPDLLFKSGFVEHVDTANYESDVHIDERQQHLLWLLANSQDRISIRKELAVTHSQLTAAINRLCSTYKTTSVARLMWAAILDKQLPGLQ